MLQFAHGRQQKGHVVTLLPLPPWGWGAEWKENDKNLVHQDKGSLTETANEVNSNDNNTDKKNIQNKQLNEQSNSYTRYPAQFGAAINFPPASSPTRAQHDGTWCRIPCFVRPLWVSPPRCVPSWLLVKINPELDEPRTRC